VNNGAGLIALSDCIDVALKALPPTINDSTIAVTTINQFHRLLRSAENGIWDASRLRSVRLFDIRRNPARGAQNPGLALLGDTLLLQPIPAPSHAGSARGIPSCGGYRIAPRRVSVNFLFAFGESILVGKLLSFCAGGIDADSHDER
jgi:hypothetical protein